VVRHPIAAATRQKICYPRAMIQLLDSRLIIEEEAPELDISMPRVYRRPPPPPFTLGKTAVASLIAKADQARRAADKAGFGKAYGELTVEFQPAIQWTFCCWEYLLSTEGCRFVPRTADEKLYCHGDYRVFTENDFRRFIFRVFKERLLAYLEEPTTGHFELSMKQTFWPSLLESYKALVQPADPRQRTLTGYSYLRCVPYQFLNRFHHQRVYAAVGQLPPEQREILEFYYLRFYREAAVLEETEISTHLFQTHRALALRNIASSDYLSYILLNQIERY